MSKVYRLICSECGNIMNVENRDDGSIYFTCNHNSNSLQPSVVEINDVNMRDIETKKVKNIIRYKDKSCKEIFIRSIDAEKNIGISHSSYSTHENVFYGYTTSPAELERIPSIIFYDIERDSYDFKIYFAKIINRVISIMKALIIDKTIKYDVFAFEIATLSDIITLMEDFYIQADINIPTLAEELNDIKELKKYYSIFLSLDINEHDQLASLVEYINSKIV